MPVKPENKARYPKDWPQIAESVKAEAGWRCQQCGVEHGEVIHRGTENGRKLMRRPSMSAFCLSLNPETGEEVKGTCGDMFEITARTRIIITVAHLDHQPENVERGNLKALCQRCHLAYDARHHARNAGETRRAKLAVGDMFGG